ncbi:nickel/cobalt efflux transporter [Taklimakanibacter deserti]|uniref:nickel/cobalt efflux transporter n=1 Tax=Taklimakanibacter deserti TaxID=2267839 RepID=UPI000E6490DD
MPSFAELLQQSSAHAWLFIPSAILLGVLHGLEPGHSKTMMAAFIVAIRGTVGQSVLLGLAATVSHTIVVWGIALAGMYVWQGLDAEAVEPYFQMASAVVIVGIALWMMWRIWKDQAHDRHRHDHHHGHPHDHHHAHGHNEEEALQNITGESAHELAHAQDIERRFSNSTVTTGQIVMFGLTGGLIPCPAAITVLLLCLQLKAFALGSVLVLCFSIGLAITLVAVGAAAALSVGHASRRWTWFATMAQRAPYLSSLLMILVGLYMGLHGWSSLA